MALSLKSVKPRVNEKKTITNYLCYLSTVKKKDQQMLYLIPHTSSFLTYFYFYLTCVYPSLHPATIKNHITLLNTNAHIKYTTVYKRN